MLALLSAVTGVALSTNCVALVMLLITISLETAPVPEINLTGMPTRRLAVVLTVTVEPLLLTFVNTGLEAPT